MPAPAPDPYAFVPPTTTQKAGGKRFGVGPGWVWYGKSKGWAWEWPGHSPPGMAPPEPDANGNLGPPGGLPGGLPGGPPPGW